MLNFAMPFPIPRSPGTVDDMAAAQDASADEARLAERAIRGDGNAFAELYGRYEKRAYNLCLRILGSEHEAADATQDAFVNVLRRLPKLEGRELAFGSYLRGIDPAPKPGLERRRRGRARRTGPEGRAGPGLGKGRRARAGRGPADARDGNAAS
jgi:sigma-70-like protein